MTILSDLVDLARRPMGSRGCDGERVVRFLAIAALLLNPGRGLRRRATQLTQGCPHLSLLLSLLGGDWVLTGVMRDLVESASYSLAGPGETCFPRT